MLWRISKARSCQPRPRDSLPEWGNIKGLDISVSQNNWVEHCLEGKFLGLRPRKRPKICIWLPIQSQYLGEEIYTSFFGKNLASWFKEIYRRWYFLNFYDEKFHLIVLHTRFDCTEYHYQCPRQYFVNHPGLVEHSTPMPLCHCPPLLRFWCRIDMNSGSFHLSTNSKCPNIHEICTVQHLKWDFLDILMIFSLRPINHTVKWGFHWKQSILIRRVMCDGCRENDEQRWWRAVSS